MEGGVVTVEARLDRDLILPARQHMPFVAPGFLAGEILFDDRYLLHGSDFT
jgi:hypothetical protein